MKIRHYIAITIFLILWESFLGFVGVFAWIELLAAFSIVTVINRNASWNFFIWAGILGVLLDFIIGRWIGIGVISIYPPLLIMDFIDDIFAIYQSSRNLLALTIFVAFNQLAIYLISIMSGDEVGFFYLLRSFVVNLMVAFLVYRLLRGMHKKEFIRV